MTAINGDVVTLVPWPEAAREGVRLRHTFARASLCSCHSQLQGVAHAAREATDDADAASEHDVALPGAPYAPDGVAEVTAASLMDVRVIQAASAAESAGTEQPSAAAVDAAAAHFKAVAAALAAARAGTPAAKPPAATAGAHKTPRRGSGVGSVLARIRREATGVTTVQETALAEG